jgi:predicted RNA-binding Zn-ribbon protein involved in translation (DUF1610 family)
MSKLITPDEIVKCSDCGDIHKHSKRIKEFSEGITYYLCPECSGESMLRNIDAICD